MVYSQIKAILSLLLLLIFNNVFAQSPILQSGPMLGFSTEEKTLLWVQTTKEAKVYYEIWKQDSIEFKLKTFPIFTKEDNGFTIKVIIDKLSPNTVYEYALYLNDSLIEFSYPLRFKTLSRDLYPCFRIAIGSCAGFTNPPDSTIFNSIYQKNPDIMLWLGDNVYLNRPQWEKKETMIEAYTAYRSVKELQPLLSSVNHYAIWDDHDYGPNDADRKFHNKALVKEVFEAFWGNPSFGLNGKGITSTFKKGDVQFFLMDNRTWRAPNLKFVGKKPYLGLRQFNWLIQSLKASTATFKIITIGNQVLNPVWAKENYSTYGKERAKLLKKIKKEGIKGVIFLSGDRHFTELSKMERPNNYPLYDLTVSPLTSNPDEKNKEHNPYRIENSLIEEKNFGILEFAGTENNRHLKITILDKFGKRLWEKFLDANILQ